jgi:hypothetical protein
MSLTKGELRGLLESLLFLSSLHFVSLQLLNDVLINISLFIYMEVLLYATERKKENNEQFFFLNAQLEKKETALTILDNGSVHWISIEHI